MDQEERTFSHQQDERAPSQVADDYWIGALRQKPGYPHAGAGKWMIHARRSHIDNLWRILKLATEEGYLGSLSKVSTTSLPYTAHTGIHTICVYTYDKEDIEDIM